MLHYGINTKMQPVRGILKSIGYIDNMYALIQWSDMYMKLSADDLAVLTHYLTARLTTSRDDIFFCFQGYNTSKHNYEGESWTRPNEGRT